MITGRQTIIELMAVNAFAASRSVLGVGDEDVLCLQWPVSPEFRVFQSCNSTSRATSQVVRVAVSIRSSSKPDKLISIRIPDNGCVRIRMKVIADLRDAFFVPVNAIVRSHKMNPS